MDFSMLVSGGVADKLDTVAKGLLAHGVTAFCPTIVTSPAEYYAAVRTVEYIMDSACPHVEALGV